MKPEFYEVCVKETWATLKLYCESYNQILFFLILQFLVKVKIIGDEKILTKPKHILAKSGSVLYIDIIGWIGK